MKAKQLLLSLTLVSSLPCLAQYTTQPFPKPVPEWSLSPLERFKRKIQKALHHLRHGELAKRAGIVVGNTKVQIAAGAGTIVTLAGLGLVFYLRRNAPKTGINSLTSKMSSYGSTGSGRSVFIKSVRGEPVEGCDRFIGIDSQSDGKHDGDNSIDRKRLVFYQGLGLAPHEGNDDFSNFSGNFTGDKGVIELQQSLSGVEASKN